MRTQTKSSELHAENALVLPGGVTSVNRPMTPPMVWHRARGAEVIDVDGNTYIDYNCAFGATILGHANPAVSARIRATLAEIDLIGLGSTALEGELARKLIEHIPSAQMAVLLNSGSEATQLALRLARAATRRSMIVKFQGCYHGSYDYVALNVITPADHIGRPHALSAGALQAGLDHTLVLSYNDCDALRSLLQARHDEIAAVILEPIQHNTGCIAASAEFLRLLRELTTQLGIVLIFDEVVTGIRHGLGGYQKICGITPDLTTIGKALANGFPIAAVVGRRDLMQRCAPPPAGDVFAAGTMNGTPAMIAAALATITQLEAPGSYARLYDTGALMRAQLSEIIERYGCAAQVAGFGSVWLPYFMRGEIRKYEDLLVSDLALDLRFRRGMLERGVLAPPTAFKRFNLTLAHTDEQIAHTLDAAEDTIAELMGAGRTGSSRKPTPAAATQERST